MIIIYDCEKLKDSFVYFLKDIFEYTNTNILRVLCKVSGYTNGNIFRSSSTPRSHQVMTEQQQGILGNNTNLNDQIY